MPSKLDQGREILTTKSLIVVINVLHIQSQIDHFTLDQLLHQVYSVTEYTNSPHRVKIIISRLIKSESAAATYYGGLSAHAYSFMKDSLHEIS